jgi:hypothetical protein
MAGLALASAVVIPALALAVATAAHAQTVVPPLPLTGPYPVGCTNVEQDLSRLPAGETAQMYWRGVSDGRHDALRRRAARLVGGYASIDLHRAP